VVVNLRLQVGKHIFLIPNFFFLQFPKTVYQWNCSIHMHMYLCSVQLEVKRAGKRGQNVVIYIKRCFRAKLTYYFSFVWGIELRPLKPVKPWINWNGWSFKGNSLIQITLTRHDTVLFYRALKLKEINNSNFLPHKMYSIITIQIFLHRKCIWGLMVSAYCKQIPLLLFYPLAYKVVQDIHSTR